MRRREGRHGHRSSGGERGSGEEGRGVRGRRGEACGSRAGAACLIVNSPGLPMLTGPMVLVWFISFISPSTRSSTKQKERVCFPSPYTVMSSPLMACPSHTGLVCPPSLAVPQRSPPPGGACMMKFETTRPSYGCIPGLEQQGSRVRPTVPQGSGQQCREGQANSAARVRPTVPQGSGQQRGLAHCLPHLAHKAASGLGMRRTVECGRRRGLRVRPSGAI